LFQSDIKADEESGMSGTDDRATRWMAGFADRAEELSGEPIRAAMLYQPAGTMRAGAAAIAGSAMNSILATRKARKKAGGLPPFVLLAVSDKNVHMFEYRSKLGRQVLSGPIKSWERSDVEVDGDTEGIWAKLHITIKSSGDQYHLESTGNVGKSMRGMVLHIRKLLQNPNNV
jgi:hypothetical protein